MPWTWTWIHIHSAYERRKNWTRKKIHRRNVNDQMELHWIVEREREEVRENERKTRFSDFCNASTKMNAPGMVIKTHTHTHTNRPFWNREVNECNSESCKTIGKTIFTRNAIYYLNVVVYNINLCIKTDVTCIACCVSYCIVPKWCSLLKMTKRYTAHCTHTLVQFFSLLLLCSRILTLMMGESNRLV